MNTTELIRIFDGWPLSVKVTLLLNENPQTLDDLLLTLGCTTTHVGSVGHKVRKIVRKLQKARLVVDTSGVLRLTGTTQPTDVVVMPHFVAEEAPTNTVTMPHVAIETVMAPVETVQSVAQPEERPEAHRDDLVSAAIEQSQIVLGGRWKPGEAALEIAGILAECQLTYSEAKIVVASLTMHKEKKYFSAIKGEAEYHNVHTLRQWMIQTILSYFAEHLHSTKEEAETKAAMEAVRSQIDATRKRSTKMHEHRCCFNAGWHRIYKLPEWVEKYGKITPELEEKFSNIEDPEIRPWWEKVAPMHPFISKYLNDPERYIPPSKAEREALADKIVEEFL